MNVSLLNLHRHFVARDSRHKEEVRNLKRVFPEGCFGRMAFNDPLPLNLFFLFVARIVTNAAPLQFSSLHQHLSPSLPIPSFDLMGQTATTTNKYCASPPTITHSSSLKQ